MLQRAASNACSWWWVSHIRTKQSKWLDSDLQEMEERVKAMLKIVEQDGDSFAKKAEMYFKKRPELIHFVEETYKAYKALADRYDHISSELHKANHTIATAFPDQIQFDMQDDDDNLPKAITSIDPSKIRKPSIEGIPPISLMNKRKDKSATLRKTRLARVASQKTIDNAQEEIDRLQKGILVLQTEKEYIKSTYESGIAKYWDIESRITDMQEEVFSLQDEFGASVVIDDDDARALMAVTALKSCEKSINKLQEQQDKAMEEARAEMEKIKDMKEEVGESIETEDIVEDNVEEELNDVVKEDVEISSATSVVELAEKINELVAKVIELELKTSSQAAQIRNLSLEADILQRHLRSIEAEKKILAEESDSMRDRLKETKEKLEKAMSGIDKSSIKGNVNDVSILYQKDQEVISLQDSEFEQYIEEKLDKKHEFDLDVKHQESAIDENASEQDIEGNAVEVGQNEKFKESVENEHNQEEEGNILNSSNDEIAESSMLPKDWEQFDSESPSQKNVSLDGLNAESNEGNFSSTPLDNYMHANNASTSQNDKDFDEKDKHEANFSSSLDDDLLSHPKNYTDSAESTAPMKIDEISLSFLQTLAKKTEGKEKLLLSEYTSILRNYKDTKKRLSEEEKKNQETKTKISALQSENTMKDEEIHSLKKKLRSLQANANNKADNVDKAAAVQLPPKPKFSDAKTRRYQSFDIGNKKPLPDMVLKQPSQPVSHIEEKFRRDLDTLLEEHLEFWLRYSTSFHSIQKFQTTFEELQTEIKKVKQKRSGEGSSSSSHYNKELQPTEKKLRELKRELQVWLEQNVLLQGELKSKFADISSVQDEISGTLEACLEASLEDDVVKFKPYQAAKFQGELLNMQNENNNVEKELKAGLEHMRGLHAEIEKTLSTLHKKDDLPEPSRSSNVQFTQSSSKNKVPLKSFLFNAKPKKKQSIFACVSPALQKHSASSRPP